MNVIKLAEMTGVSKSTIYRAINGDKIKDSTRQKIIDTINENDVGFKFSVFDYGSDIRVKLAALITDSSAGRRSFTAEHIKNRFSENGFTVIEISSETVENGSSEIEKLIGKDFKSFIFLGSGLDFKCSEFIHRAAETRPVILINSDMTGRNIFSIETNERETLARTICKLSDNYGHRNFLYCISDKSDYGKQLTYGFEDGIILSGLDRNSFCAADCCGGRLTPAEIIFTALKNNPEVTAVITQDEATAAAAVKAASALGLKIPRDVTVVSFRNSGITTSEASDIACIDAKSETVSDMALTLTIAAINGKHISKHIDIPCSFLQKRTVGKAAPKYSKAI